MNNNDTQYHSIPRIHKMSNNMINRYSRYSVIGTFVNGGVDHVEDDISDVRHVHRIFVVVSHEIQHRSWWRHERFSRLSLVFLSIFRFGFLPNCMHVVLSLLTRFIAFSLSSFNFFFFSQMTFFLHHVFFFGQCPCISMTNATVFFIMASVKIILHLHNCNCNCTRTWPFLYVFIKRPYFYKCKFFYFYAMI